MSIAGTWKLKTWRRVEAGGGYSYPFGEHPHGMLIYTADGNMCVQMVVADRARIDSDDALSGPIEQRAQAYSTCLAYFGRYEVDARQVVHHIDGSLFPNWSNEDQARPYLLNGHELVLQVVSAEGVLTNEILWQRAG